MLFATAGARTRSEGGAAEGAAGRTADTLRARACDAESRRLSCRGRIQVKEVALVIQEAYRVAGRQLVILQVRDTLLGGRHLLVEAEDVGVVDFLRAHVAEVISRGSVVPVCQIDIRAKYRSLIGGGRSAVVRILRVRPAHASQTASQQRPNRYLTCTLHDGASRAKIL